VWFVALPRVLSEATVLDKVIDYGVLCFLLHHTTTTTTNYIAREGGGCGCSFESGSRRAPVGCALLAQVRVV